MANAGVRRQGWRLFLQQFKALMHKNLLLSLRNQRAFLLQLASSFWFIFLLFGVDQASMASRMSDSYYRDVPSPKAVQVSAIPDCELSKFINPPCYDFVWSDHRNSHFRTIVRRIMANNPGRPIHHHKVRGFASTEEVDEWFLANPRTSNGALHLQRKPSGVISYGLQFNSTPSTILLRGKHENAPFYFQVPLQAAAEREITRFLTGRHVEWNVSFSEYAHPSLGRFSSVGTIGPTFMFAATMFSVVILISKIVYEKELKLRQAMSTMGLYDSVYWLSWLAWETSLALCSSIILIVFGMIFQLNFFVNNSFSVLLLIFFLFQFNMIGFAFLVSTFISKTETSNSLGFCIFIFGSLTQLVTTMGFPYDRRYPSYIGPLWSTFPPNVFAIGLFYLGEATASKKDTGLNWSDIMSCPSTHDECTIVIGGIFCWLIGTFFVWFSLAIYFDNVLKDANGQRKSCIYFLKPSYWTGHSCQMKDRNFSNDGEGGQYPVDAGIAVQLRGLWKTFSDVTGGPCRKASPYHAVQGVWLNIEKDQVFCLLGHNGAGKTTIINILTGVIPLTSGDALIYGASVKENMSKLRHSMGVCPQFNILWESLTGREHLQIFANIKGLVPSKINMECKKLLRNSNLVESAKQRVSTYCGGMKRRLSVAIALIGDPKIVFLDEPTTGMDPISRKHVWDVIDKSKCGRAVILTTHSMEEADNLGDFIAIMANGKLQCVGTSIHLKQQFGRGYSLTCGVRDEGQGVDFLDKTAIKEFFSLYLAMELQEETNSYITFTLPNTLEEKLPSFFHVLQASQEELCISHIQLSLSTLEEVFLNVLKESEE